MPNTRKILIVDDDPGLRDALTEQLSLHEEFEAIAVENGSKGVQTAKAGQIDLVIMDVGLPDIDGREAVRILRKNGFKAPIIMLTGHNTDSDTILGRSASPCCWLAFAPNCLPLRRRSREPSPGSELAPWERVLSE
jgi:DNA-binding response OmpR family regulator